MATSTFGENYIPKTNDESNIIDWEPFTLTLVEYPKGKYIRTASIHENVISFYVYYFILRLCEDIAQKISTISNILRFYSKIGWVSGDIIGKILALISLAPFGIGSGFLTLILFRRDLHTVNYFI